MKNYFITTQNKKIILQNIDQCELYTIEKNPYRSWIKVNISVYINEQIIVAFKLGRKWNEKELNDFKIGSITGDYYVLYLLRTSYYPNFEYPIFEDKKTFERECYKGSINFAFRSSSNNEMPFRITYLEESEDKKNR